MPVRKPVPHYSSPPDYPTFTRELSVLEAAARQLAPQELSIFQEGLYDYEKRHNLEAFVKCLDYVLNTTQKRRLIFPVLNSVVRPSDRAKFSQLLIRYGLAVPAQHEPSKGRQSSSPSTSPPPKAQLKKVQIKQDPSGEWGFDIRGGSEHGVGVYVSWVDPGSAADRAGVKPGDQIVKANGTSFEAITHCDAVGLIRNANKLRLTISSQGMLPMDHSLTPHMYRWVDPSGRPCTPPPERHLMLSHSPSGHLDSRVHQEPDVQKVNLFLQMGDGYGLSIRGGIEHGLGIYVSFVEPGSMAAINGVKMGDQILEVNGISFLSATHDDAAKILKSSQMLVMTVRHIGKLPHSKLPQYGQTQWHRMSPEQRLPEDFPGHRPKEPSRTVFAKGVGTQVMHKKQRMGQTSARHMMLELARTLLAHNEWKTFSYYLDQYESEKIGVEDFVVALLRLLNTDEKKGLLSEVRPVIAARDLDRFNELTVHAEIAARNRMVSGGGSKDSLGGSSTSSGPMDDMIPGLAENFTMKSKTAKQSGMYTVQGSNSEGDGSPYPSVKVTNYNVNNNSTLVEGDATLTPARAMKVDSPVTRAKRAGAKPSGSPIFRAPPPPSTPPTQPKRPTTSPQPEAGGHSTSTPQGAESPDPKDMLATTLQERRKRVNPGSFVKKPGDSELHEETWDGTWNETTLSAIHPTGHSQQETPPGPKTPEAVNGASDDDQQQPRGLSVEDVRAMEEQITREAEEKARQEFQELLAREREDLLQKQEEQRLRWLNEERLRWQEEERARLQEEERARREEEVARMEEEEQERIAMEDQIRREAQESVKKQYESLLKQEAEERARLAAEVEARRAAEERLEAQLRIEEEERARREEEQRSHEAEQKKWEAEWAKLEEEKLRLKERQQRERDEAAQREAQARRDAELEAERQRQAAEEQRASEEQRQEEERLRRLEDEQQQEERARALERQQRQEASDRQAREEAQRRAAEDSRRLQEETERKQREETERKQREEAERKQREEAERKQREEAERRQREEAERKQREEAERRQREEAERKQREEAERKQREETERRDKEVKQQTQTDRPGLVVRHEKVKLGDDSPKPGGGRAQPAVKGVREDVARAVAVAQDRKKYNDLLSRRLGKQPQTGSRSHREFTNLNGEVLTVEIHKSTKRLGIAIVGGSDSKIKIIKIKEITPGCCAALTGVGLRVGQQILSVDDKSLFGLQHKEAAIAIKNAFDSADKVMKLTVLDPSDD